MRTPLPTWIIILSILLPVCTARAQERQALPGKQNQRAQPFFFEALNFGQYDEYGITSRIDVYVQVPFDLVTFIKKDMSYIAFYTVTVLLTDEEGHLLREESWTRRIERQSFDHTVDPGFSDVSQHSIVMDPGPVIVSVVIEDKESSKEYRSSKRISVRRFDKNLLGISDIMLISAVEQREGKQQLSPHLEPNVAGLKDGFSLFYEVYNPLDITSVMVRYTLTQQNKTVMRKTDRQTVKRGSNAFLSTVGMTAFSVGTYEVTVEVFGEADTSEGGLLGKESKPFVVEWLSGGTPVSISDLDEAIEQLKYFAKSEDIDHIREATDEAERRARFETFWERNNPVPGSSYNRAMVEYYMRVAYANEHFRHYVAGWKTDRGMVYIIYGKPDVIDRHPLDVELKPYEVWEYYDVNRRFVFIDEMGFGDYRLLYPIWDDRNRLR